MDSVCRLRFQFSQSSYLWLSRTILNSKLRDFHAHRLWLKQHCCESFRLIIKPIHHQPSNRASLTSGSKGRCNYWHGDKLCCSLMLSLLMRNCRDVVHLFQIVFVPKKINASANTRRSKIRRAELHFTMSVQRLIFTNPFTVEILGFILTNYEIQAAVKKWGYINVL